MCSAAQGIKVYNQDMANLKAVGAPDGGGMGGKRKTLQMTLCKLITTVGKTTQNHNQVGNIIFGL